MPAHHGGLGTESEAVCCVAAHVSCCIIASRARRNSGITSEPGKRPSAPALHDSSSKCVTLSVHIDVDAHVAVAVAVAVDVMVSACVVVGSVT